MTAVRVIIASEPYPIDSLHPILTYPLFHGEIITYPDSARSMWDAIASEKWFICVSSIFVQFGEDFEWNCCVSDPSSNIDVGELETKIGVMRKEETSHTH